METYRNELFAHRGEYAPVSKQTPLLSNLTVIENIALIPEVHEGLSRSESHHAAREKLKKAGMEKLSSSRTSQCDEYETFVIGLIRASMMRYATIVIIRPMQQYYAPDPIGELIRLIHTLEIDLPVWVLDLKLHENSYREKGLECHTNG